VKFIHFQDIKRIHFNILNLFHFTTPLLFVIMSPKYLKNLTLFKLMFKIFAFLLILIPSSERSQYQIKKIIIILPLLPSHLFLLTALFGADWMIWVVLFFENWTLFPNKLINQYTYKHTQNKSFPALLTHMLSSKEPVWRNTRVGKRNT